MIVNNCVRCGCNADTLYHVDGAKSITEWVCGNCAIGYAIPKTDHLAAIKELTDRLAKVERDLLADELTNTRVSRDSANDRADRAEELNRGKSCAGCIMYDHKGYDKTFCQTCARGTYTDHFKPRDPSAEKGG